MPGPVFTAMIGRLRQRAITGQLTLCPHLSYDAPEPAVWCAWAPGRLRCASCAHTTQKRLERQGETYTGDVLQPIERPWILRLKLDHTRVIGDDGPI